VSQSTGRGCGEDAAADPSNTDCVPIARANGTRMGEGTVGYGGQVHSSYQTKTRMLRLDYVGHSPTFDVNDAGFSPVFDRLELVAVGGFTDREPGEYLLFRGIFPFAISAVGFDGSPQYSLVGFDLEATFKNHLFTSPEQWILMPKHKDPFETFDGAHFEQPAAWEGTWEAGTNPAKMVSAYARWRWFLGLGDENRATSLYTSFALQAASNVEVALEPEVGIDHSVRFFDCATPRLSDELPGKSCLIDRSANTYTFADLDSKYFSTTLRATMTIAPPLSFQGYAQLFLAEGEWADFKGVTTSGARPTIRRDDLKPMTGFTYDGGADFKDAALNVNLVLRWEVDPGSTLFMVYTRSQAAGYQRYKLDTGPTEDVLLVKFVYYASK
jgi:hypothetical protein